MHIIDWLVVIIPMTFILWIAWYSGRYSRGVVDYVAAGRVARRYVLTTGELTAALSLLSLIGQVEMNCQAGYALHFWNSVGLPVSILIGLTGFVTYRFRETQALSNGQLLELRYNKSIRVIGSFIRIIAEMLANSVGPAIAAKFFIYFLGLPHTLNIGGVTFSTYMLLVVIILGIALAVILPGGRIALTVTDSIQAIICYPIFVILTFFILYHFSWGQEILPVLSNRVPGESFINPFDVFNLRDFNLFMVIFVIIQGIYARGCYIGNDSTCAAINPHEQKMAGVLANWRFGFSSLMIFVIVLCVLTMMNHPDFAAQAHSVRTTLSGRVMEQIVPADPEAQRQMRMKAEKLSDVQTHALEHRVSRLKNVDTPYLEAAHQILGQTAEGNRKFQEFRTLYQQMMMPFCMRRLLPVGLVGVFCLLCVMLMVTTDDSRIFNASAAIVQDLVVPFRRKPMPPKQHLFILRVITVGVAFFFFLCSILFSQVDFIMMFITILSGIWTGGACPIVIFGLYSRFGNPVGAFSAMIVGCGTSLTGVLLQVNWAKSVYPCLVEHGLVAKTDLFLRTVSGPFNPYIKWAIDPVKFPINSYEILFLAMLFGTLAYIIGSLAAFRRYGLFNLDRMLHRGIYCPPDKKTDRTPLTFRNFFSKIIGITPEYTKGDRVLAWSVFIWSVVIQFGLFFLFMVIWVGISPLLEAWPGRPFFLVPWNSAWWGPYFFITNILVSIIAGLVTTVWFFWGGVKDIVQLFKDLAKRVDNPLDNGQVQGNMSLSDIAENAELERKAARNTAAVGTPRPQDRDNAVE